LGNYTIEIEPFATGTLLTPTGASQTMAVQHLRGLYITIGFYEREKIVLDTSDEVSYLFSAYCITFFEPNPNSTTIFTVNGTTNQNVIKIFNAVDQLSENITTVEAIQTAIFVVTDNVSQSELQETFPDGVPEIPHAQTILNTAGIDTSTKRLFS
jgi:hypothetical protein